MTKKRIETHAIGGKHGATCGELLAIINEYVDGGAAPAVCKDLEAHLAGCNPCRVVVDNVRKTITLFRKDKPCKLPAGFSERLLSALRTCWKETGPGKKRPKTQ